MNVTPPQGLIIYLFIYFSLLVAQHVCTNQSGPLVLISPTYITLRINDTVQEGRSIRDKVKVSPYCPQARRLGINVAVWDTSALSWSSAIFGPWKEVLWIKLHFISFTLFHLTQWVFCLLYVHPAWFLSVMKELLSSLLIHWFGLHESSQRSRCVA